MEGNIRDRRMNGAPTPRTEVERICRVSDMLCSAHSLLRDRYSQRSLLLDLALLGASIWLVALAFVDPKLNHMLTPFGIDPQLWTGLLCIVVFFFSMLQLYVKWKERGSAHARSAHAYSELKRETKRLLAVPSISAQELQEIADQSSAVALISAPIAERDFLKAKKSHLNKVRISRHLDSHPSTSILLLRTKLWVRDNF
jgi:hypothetical protein